MDILTAELADGRTISVPLLWYPRLVHATQQERDYWQLIGDGEGIHWPDLDEDISVQDLLGGWPSGEGQRSLQRWLDAKREGRPLTLDALLAQLPRDIQAQAPRASNPLCPLHGGRYRRQRGCRRTPCNAP